MGRVRTFDMEEAIGTATQLFWRGYDNTSLTDLTGALGIGAASFYHAFASKEALFREVVSRYIATLEEAYVEAFEAPSTTLGIKALLCRYADVVTGAGHVPGCLVVNNAPSIHAGDTLKQWLAEHREALRIRLEERFAANGTGDGLTGSSNPKTMARLVLALAAGIAVEAQAGASRHELYDMVNLALEAFSTS